MKTVLLEALLVGATGLLLALSANALSPRGLRLSRNYFPLESRATAQAHVAAPKPAIGTNSAPVAAAVQAQAQEYGLALADTDQALRLFNDPRREQGGIIFVDARDSEHYQAGHIPGAWQLDYYHKEEYLPSVLPVCLAAQQVVVYCTGGACEDSLLTAKVLLAPVVSTEKLLVYAGGFTDWTNRHLPVELGERNSGRLAGPEK